MSGITRPCVNDPPLPSVHAKPRHRRSRRHDHSGSRSRHISWASCTGRVRTTCRRVPCSGASGQTHVDGLAALWDRPDPHRVGQPGDQQPAVPLPAVGAAVGRPAPARRVGLASLASTPRKTRPSSPPTSPAPEPPPTNPTRPPPPLRRTDQLRAARLARARLGRYGRHTRYPGNGRRPGAGHGPPPAALRCVRCAPGPAQAAVRRPQGPPGAAAQISCTPAHRDQAAAVVPLAHAVLARPGVRDPVADRPARRLLRGGAPQPGGPLQRDAQAARPRPEPVGHPDLAQHRERTRTRCGQPGQCGPELSGRQGGQSVGVCPRRWTSPTAGRCPRCRR